jgi:spore coat protein JC
MGKGELLMWTYNKILQYPINIKCTDPKLAKVIISQYGGPDGEIGAALRYLSQRFAMPDQKSKAVLNDIRNRRISSLRNGRNYSTSINRRSIY